MEFRKGNLPKEWAERELYVPSWLLQLIAKCLEKAPGNRFADGVSLHQAVSENIVAESEDGAANALALLRMENKLLQDEVELYKHERAVEKTMVKIPGWLLAGIMILLLGSVTFAVFKSPKIIVPPAVRDTIVRYKQRIIADSFAIRKAKHAVIDSLKKDSVKRAEVKKNALDHKKTAPKKKKKKFLGIF